MTILGILIDYVSGRLTLTSGTPVTTSDVTAATTLYFTPYKGDRIALYDPVSANWKFYTFAERSLSLSGFIIGVCYDIFLYDAAGTLTLEQLAWKKVVASNSPTAGANKVINLSDTATLAVGMPVTVKDGTNSEIAIVSVVVASTSITVENLVNGYTTPDVYGYADRATQLAAQNGVYCKTGSLDRRYLGTILMTATGQTEDSLAKRFVYNYYNRVNSKMYVADNAGSYSYTTAAWRISRNSRSNRLQFLCGIREDIAWVSFIQYIAITTNPAYAGLAVNNEGASVAVAGATSDSAGSSVASVTTITEVIPVLGFNYVSGVEYGSTGASYGAAGGALYTQWSGHFLR